MVVTSNYSSLTYSRQTYSVKGVGFAEMLAGKSAGKSSGNDLASAFSSGSDDDIIKLYEQLTGQKLDMGSDTTSGSGFMPLVFLLKSGKIDTTRQLNEDSKGDKQLTAEQITELKSKYDLNNLSYQDQYDLFCDLTDMGVLTVADAKSVGGCTMIKVGLTVSTTTITAYTGEFRGLGFMHSSNHSNLLEYLMETIGREREDYGFMMGLCQGVDSDKDNINYIACETFKGRIEQIETNMAQHQKVANVLLQLL